MVNRLVRFPLTLGAQGGALDAWLPASSPFLDRGSLRCHTFQNECVLAGGQKWECHNRGSSRTRDRDKSLTWNFHNPRPSKGMNQVRAILPGLSVCPVVPMVMVN